MSGGNPVVRLADVVATRVGAGFAVAEWVDHGESSPARPVAPPHLHRSDHEAWYVVEGRLGVLLNGQTVEADPGELIWAEPGQVHTYWNAGPATLRYLLIASPRVFELIAAIHTERPADPDQLTALFDRFDSTLVAQPSPGGGST